MRTDHSEKVWEIGIEYAENVVTAQVIGSVACDDSSVYLTVQVDAASARELLELAYPQYREKILIPGMRPGQAPLEMVERMYGKVPGATDEVIHTCVSATFSKAAKAIGLDAWVSTLGKPRGNIEVGWRKNGPLTYRVSYDRPTAVLGQYKGLVIPKCAAAAVTDEDILAVINKELADHPEKRRITARAVQYGDDAIIDYTCYLDGRIVKDGSRANYCLNVGSHTLINGFEEQIVGHHVGDCFYVDAVLPNDYPQEVLAGRKAVFSVRINAIFENVPMDLEDYVAGMKTEYATVEDYVEHIWQYETAKREEEAYQEKQNAVLQKLIEHAELVIPQSMVDAECQNIVDSYDRYTNKKMGVVLEVFLMGVGKTKEQLIEEQRETALYNVETALLLEEIVRREGIRVTGEEIEAEYERIADDEGITKAQLKRIKDADELIPTIAKRKAMDLIMDWAREI